MKIILKDADFSANNVGKVYLEYVNMLDSNYILPSNETESLGSPIVTKIAADAPISGVDAFELKFTRAIQTSSSNTPFVVTPAACTSIPANYKGSIVLGFWTTQILYGSNIIRDILGSNGNDVFGNAYGRIEIKTSGEQTGALSSSNVTGTWKGKVVETKVINDVTWRYICVIVTLEDYNDLAAGAKPLALPGYNAYSSWFGREDNTDEDLTIRVQNITICYGDEYLDPYKVY